MGILNRFRPVIAIDAGTQNLRAGHDGKMIFDEATAIAFHPKDQKVGHIGNAAVNSKGLQVWWPYDYVIKDFEAFDLLLNGVTKKVKHKGLLLPTYRMFFVFPWGQPK